MHGFTLAQQKIVKMQSVFFEDLTHSVLISMLKIHQLYSGKHSNLLTVMSWNGLPAKKYHLILSVTLNRNQNKQVPRDK